MPTAYIIMQVSILYRKKHARALVISYSYYYYYYCHRVYKDTGWSALCTPPFFPYNNEVILNYSFWIFRVYYNHRYQRPWYFQSVRYFKSFKGCPIYKIVFFFFWTPLVDDQIQTYTKYLKIIWNNSQHMF